MRARNAGNFPCASCTVPVHTSCSGSLPGPSQANSCRPYSIVPTPVLLADVFSGVRIGEERRNVRGEGSLLARVGVSFEYHFLVKSIFGFFLNLLRRSSLFTPVFRCPFVQFPRLSLSHSLTFLQHCSSSSTSH